MSKTKLVWINLIIWPVAVLLIFFNNYAVSHYYRLKNGDTFQLNNSEYVISSRAFVIGLTDSGNFGLGYVQDNVFASLSLRSGSLDEIEELESMFSSDLKVIETNHCKFLLNSKNPNLPYLSWVNSETKLYFTITDKPDFDIEFTKFCNIVS